MLRRGYFIVGLFLILIGMVLFVNSFQNITGFVIVDNIEAVDSGFAGVSLIFAGIFYLLFSKKRKVKGQAAVEFLMTYGWAILAAVIVLGVLAFFGIFKSDTLIGGSAVINPPFYLKAWSANSNEIILDIRNSGSENYNIHRITVKIDEGAISCNTPSVNPIPSIAPDNNLAFTIPCPELESKKRIKGDIIVEYSKFSSNLIQISYGTINDKVSSSLFTFSTTFPTIEFTDPTPQDETIQASNSIYVNVSATDTNNISSFIDFDGSLISWFRMDDLNSSGGVVDYTGRNNGTAVGNAVQNSSRKLGKSFSFDGSGDYISLPGASSLNILGNLTISTWVKTSSTDLRIIFSAYDTISAPYNGYGLSIGVYAPGVVNFWSGSNGDQLWRSGGSATVNNGNWHHVAVTLVNNTLTFYIDGVSIATNSSNPSNSYSGSRAIGALTDGSFSFDGSIDDLLIFNRSLTGMEIMALYANSTSKYYSREFVSLNNGLHNFKAYAQDLNGNVQATETRNVNISFDDSYIYTCIDLNESNKIYTLQNNLVSSGTCLNILANNITLNSNGYSISGIINGSNSTGDSFSNFTLKNSPSINGNVIFRGGVDGTGKGKNGGAVTVINSILSIIESNGGSATIGNIQAGSGGAVTVTNSIIQNISTQSGSIVSGFPAGGPGGAVNVTNSTVNLIETMAGNNLYPGSPGGAVTVVNSNITLINSTGSAGYNAGKGGAVTVTGSIVNKLFSSSGWSASYGNAGGAVTIISSTVSEVFSLGTGGNYNAGSGGAITAINSNVTNITNYAGNILASGFTGVMNGGSISITSIYPVSMRSIIGYGGNSNNRTAGNGSTVRINAPIINLTNAMINITNGIGSGTAGKNGTAGSLTLNYTTLTDTNALYYKNIFLTLMNENGIVAFIPIITSNFNSISQNFNLSNNFVNLNTPSITALNVSANITLYGIPTNFVNPAILRDGSSCTAPNCNNFTSLNAGTVKFNVTSWTNYKIGEAA